MQLIAEDYTHPNGIISYYVLNTHSIVFLLYQDCLYKYGNYINIFKFKKIFSFFVIFLFPPDFCGYLEEEEESTTVQKFIDHLLHKDVVDSGMLEDLGMNGKQDKKQQKDPRLTMEIRHKQVGGKNKIKMDNRKQSLYNTFNKLK